LKNPNDIQIAKRHLETQMILKYVNDIELFNEKKSECGGIQCVLHLNHLQSC